MYVRTSVGIPSVLLKYGWMSMLSSTIQLDQGPKESSMESKHNKTLITFAKNMIMY